MTDERRQRIVDVIISLGPGEVTTYGEVAEDAGYPRHARLVGQILASTTAELPWWRVVTADGRLVPGNQARQRDLLQREGVTVARGRVRSAPFGRFRGAVADDDSR